MSEFKLTPRYKEHTIKMAQKGDISAQQVCHRNDWSYEPQENHLPVPETRTYIKSGDYSRHRLSDNNVFFGKPADTESIKKPRRLKVGA